MSVRDKMNQQQALSILRGTCAAPQEKNSESREADERRARMFARGLITLFVAIALCGAMGCVDENNGFYIKQMAKPGENCSPSSEAAKSAEYLPAGKLDVSIGLGYVAFPVLLNSLNSTVQENGIAPERNNLSLREIQVDLNLGGIPGSYADSLVHFSLATSGTIAPDDGQVSKVKIVPDALAAALQKVVPDSYNPMIIATLRAVASHGGSDIETGEFFFPIELCNKCLVDNRGSNCPSATDTTENTILTNACGLPQDLPVTCCKAANVPLPKCFTTK
jgi:hypothetical protein